MTWAIAIKYASNTKRTQVARFGLTTQRSRAKLQLTKNNYPVKIINKNAKTFAFFKKNV